MRFVAICVGAALVLLAGCDGSSEPLAPPEQPAPPEPSVLGAPPPVAPPPPIGLCPPFPPGYIPPADAPSAGECAAMKEERERSAQALREELAEMDPQVWTPEGGLPPLGQRTDPNPDRGSWMQQLTPTSLENCSFTPRGSTDRPADLDLLAWSGNMDLYGQGNILAHDHAIGFVEAGWMVNRPVIAVRQGMLDLWIQPREPWDRVTLIITDKDFYCHRWSGD